MYQRLKVKDCHANTNSYDTRVTTFCPKMDELIKDTAGCINPLPNMPILGSSNSPANKDMMSKNRQMEIHLSDRVENRVGKGEIARYEQFLLFPQCF